MAKVLKFDDIEVNQKSGYAPVEAPYGGLNWSDILAFDPSLRRIPGGKGYENGVVSGRQDAYCPYQGTSHVMLASGSFDLRSVYLTAPFEKSDTIEIYGYRQGAEIYHQTVAITKGKPTLVQLDFNGVDDVSFHPASGNGIVFDNMVVAHVKGEPVSIDPLAAFGPDQTIVAHGSAPAGHLFDALAHVGHALA